MYRYKNKAAIVTVQNGKVTIVPLMERKATANPALGVKVRAGMPLGNGKLATANHQVHTASTGKVKLKSNATVNIGDIGEVAVAFADGATNALDVIGHTGKLSAHKYRQERLNARKFRYGRYKAKQIRDALRHMDD